MKTLITSSAAWLAVSASLATLALAAGENNPKLVNAYGEPAGFGSLPDVVVPDTPELNRSQSRPGTAGLYVVAGSFDRRNYESLGAWKERHAAETRGNVIIGPIEILDSGPTGPLSPEAIAAAREEVTTTVLTRIKATDHAMSSLQDRAKTLDDAQRGQFQAAADEVAQRRAALRESLKTMRAADGDQWSEARSNVAVSYNAYVQSQHHAEEVAGINQRT